MSLIIICSGGGKTTLSKNNEGVFVDIDTLVWSKENEKHHPPLKEAIQGMNIFKIAEIYRKIIKKNKKNLLNCGKVILAHHPICGDWLGIKPILTLKPTQTLHQECITDYEKSKKCLSSLSWQNLADGQEFSTFQELQKIVLNKIN
jgi:hypothetical protein